MIRSTSIKTLSVLLAFVFILSLGMACTQNWKSDAVVGMEAGQITLETISSATIIAYKNGVITAEDYEKVRSLHTKAVDTYVVCGKALKAAIETEDKIVQKTLFSQYKSLLGAYQDLYVDLVKLATELKILK